MNEGYRAPFPGQRGSRTGGVLRSRIFWSGIAGGLIVTGGALKIAGVSASEIANMGKTTLDNNADAIEDSRRVAGSEIAGEEINTSAEGAAGNEQIDIAAALEGSNNFATGNTEASQEVAPAVTSQLGATALIVNPEKDTLFSAAQACGLDVTGDGQDAKLESAAQSLATDNTRFEYSGPGSWQGWDFSGDIVC